MRTLELRAPHLRLRRRAAALLLVTGAALSGPAWPASAATGPTLPGQPPSADPAQAVGVEGSLPPSAGLPTSVTLLSATRFGRPANHVYYSAMSSDARTVMFTATSKDLMPGVPPSDFGHVFVRDVTSGATRVVDVPGDVVHGRQATVPHAFLSGDGLAVAVPPRFWDAYPDGRDPLATLNVLDLRSGTWDRIPGPGAPAGTPPGTRSAQVFPSGLSFDGRYVAASVYYAVPGSRATAAVFDRLARTWQLADPALGTYGGAPQISGDGRYVAYYDSLPSPNPSGDVTEYLFDRVTGLTRTIPRGPAPARSRSGTAALSADGKILAVTWSDNLYRFPVTVVLYRTHDLAVVDSLSFQRLGYTVALDGNGQHLALSLSFYNRRKQQFRDDAWVFDRRSRTMTKMSQTPAGQPGNASSSPRQLSADGRTVLFESFASTFSADDERPYEGYNSGDVFLATTR